MDSLSCPAGPGSLLELLQSERVSTGERNMPAISAWLSEICPSPAPPGSARGVEVRGREGSSGSWLPPWALDRCFVPAGPNTASELPQSVAAPATVRAGKSAANR